MDTIDVGVVLDGRYRVAARRAAGATATVWECEDEFLRRRVAVKILHPHLAADPDLRARFIEEARTAATVNHPNLVAVYDSITSRPGIVLEWVDGPDLRQRLDQGPMEPADVARIGAAICDGLAALHARGLVHRDVKPANILLPVEGTPKLTDFGIATANAGDRTATGVVLGTAKYLAPEQVRGLELDGRADVFALAAVLHEALAGAPPWVREGDLPTALARLEEDPPDLALAAPSLPPDLVATVRRGLEREPSARWSTALDFARALRTGSTLPPPPEPPTLPPATDPTILAGTNPVADPTEIVVPASRHRRAGAHLATKPVRPRRRRWPRLVGLLVVTGIAFLGWTLVASGHGDDAPPIAGADVISIERAVAFDPEGTGAPGEHNDRAALAIDVDTATSWPTERYASRTLGAKSGVGLVLTLDRVSEIHEVTIRTQDARDWAVEIRVATGVTAESAGAVADFGEVRGTGSGLGSIATVPVSAIGDTVVVWVTDLGAGDPPIRLAISEITIR